VPYFHVVFTLPAAIGAIAHQNKAAVYGLLFTAAAQALTTIAADPKFLGAEIGATAVLHTYCARWRHRAGSQPMGSLPAWLFPARARVVAIIPSALS
jgi:hypothetical protein